MVSSRDTGYTSTLAVVGLSVALAACSSGSPPNNQSSRPSTTATPTTAPTPAVVPVLEAPDRSTYDAILSVIARLAEAGRAEREAALARLKATDPAAWAEQTKELDLYHCGGSGYDLMGDDTISQPHTTMMVLHAYDMWWLRNSTAAFPAGAWQRAIDDYEQRELQRLLASKVDTRADLTDDEARRTAIEAAITDAVDAGYDAKMAFLNSIAEQLNAVRGDRQLPTVVVVGGCGGGTVSVRIVTDPAGGQVMFIPTFFYELCRAKSIDPDDPVGCKRWREALGTASTAVAGDYHYIVRWADGAVRRGKLSITDNQDGRTITLGKVK